MANSGRTVGVSAEMEVSNFNRGLLAYMNGLNQMSSATVEGVNKVNSQASAITTGIAAALGVTAVQAINTFVSALKHIGEDAIEQVGFFERLAISLNFFAARAIQSARDGLGLDDAMKQTAGTAQDLLIWLQQLALASPFTTRQVSDAFRTAQAYGLSLAAAEKLVPLMVDFASVNNFSDDILTRISLALGQIQARGKLASQEINQLANAGVPVRDVLAKGLNVTRGEFEKMLQDGVVPASSAMAILIKYFEQFQGLGEKITRQTLSGMISQFVDLKEIASRNLFSGIGTVAIPVLGQISDLVNTPQVFAGLTEIGNILGGKVRDGITSLTSVITSLINTLVNLPDATKQAIFVFIAFGTLIAATTIIVGAFGVVMVALVNQVTLVAAVVAGFAAAWVTNFGNVRTVLTNFESIVESAITGAANAISKFANFATTTIGRATDALTGFSSELANWGSDIMGILASGIGSGASFIADALTSLTSVFAYFLQPHSPPRILPDLEKWGQETANIWLRSWSSADFGILKDLSANVGDFLSGLVSAGQLGEEKPPRILIQLRPLLAGAVEEFKQFGAISTSTFTAIQKAAGPASSAITPLLNNYLALGAATDAVTSAQKQLNEITDKYTAALKPLQDQLNAITKQRSRVDENREILTLQRTIANVGVSDSIKKSSQLRIQEILLGRQVGAIKDQQTSEEDAAKSRLDAAQKQRDLVQEALDQVRAQIDAQTEQLKLYGEEKKILEQIAKEQERLAKEALKKQLDDLKKALDIAQLFQGVLKDTVQLFKDEHILGDANSTAAEKSAAALDKQRIAAQAIVDNFQAVQLGIDPAELDKIRQTIVTLSDIGIKGTGIDDFSESIFGATDAIDGLAKKAKEAAAQVQKFFTDITNQWNSFLDRIDATLPSFLHFRNETDAASQSVSDAARSAAASNKEFGRGAPILRAFGSLIAGIATAFTASRLVAIITSLPAKLVAMGSGFGLVVSALSFFAAAWVGDWFDIREKTAKSIDSTKKALDDFWKSDAWKNITDRFNSVVDIVKTFVIQLTNQFNNLVANVQGVFRNGFDPTAIRDILTVWYNDALAFAQQFLLIFTLVLPAPIKNFFSNLIGFVQKYWNPFTAILLLNSQTTAKVLGSIFGPLAKGVGGVLKFALSSVLSQVSGLPKSILSFAGSKFLSAGQALGKLLLAPLTSPTFANGIAKAVSATASGIINLLSGKPFTDAQAKFQAGWQASRDVVVRVGDFIEGIQKKFIFTSFGATFSANLKSINNALGGAANFVEKFTIPLQAGLKTIVDITKQLISDFRAFAGIKISGIFDAIRNIPTLFRGGITAVRDFVLAFKNLPTILLDSVRGLGTFIASFKGLFGKLNITGNLTSSLGGISKSIQGFLKQFSGLSGQLKISGNLQNVFGAVAGFITNISKGFGSGVFNSISSVFGLLGKFKFSNLVSGFQSLIKIIKNIGVAFEGFINPLDIVLAAIDFFFFAFRTDIKGVENPVQKFVANLKTAWADLISGKLWGEIVNGFTVGLQFITDAWAEFQNGGFSNPKLQKRLLDLGTLIVTSLKQIGSDIWTSITDFWIPVFGLWIKTSIENMGTQIGEILIFLRDFLVGAGTFIYNLIVTSWIPAFTSWWGAGGGEQGLLDTLSLILTTVTGWIVTSAVFLYDNFVVNWVPQFFTWLVAVTPGLIEGLVVILFNISKWIIEQIPFLVTTMLNWATAFVSWLGPVVKFTLENLGVWMGALLEWIIGTGIPMLIGGIIELGGILVSWISGTGPQSATQQVPGALLAFLSAVVNFLIQFVIPGIISAGTAIGLGLWRGITEAWDKFLETSWGQHVEAFINNVVGFVERFFTIGGQIAKGMIDGITAYFDVNFVEPAKSFIAGIQYIIDGVLNFLGIHSPSTLMRDLIGIPMVQGLVDGVESIYNNPLFDGIKNLATSGFGALKDGAVGIFGDMESAVGTIIKTVHDNTIGVVTDMTDQMRTIITAVVTDVETAVDNLRIFLQSQFISIRTSAVTETGTLYTKVLQSFTDLNSQLGLKMPLLVSIVSLGFQSMRTEAVTQVGLLVTDVLAALVGDGTINDTTSLAALLRLAMQKAGELVGEAFVQGIAQGIQSDASLTLLTQAVYTIISKAFDEAQKQTESGSPSKRAAREVGLPWSQGVAVGIMGGISGIAAAASQAAASTLSSAITSQFAPRSGTGVPGVSSTTNSTRQFNLSVNSRQSSMGIINDFSLMKTLDP